MIKVKADIFIFELLRWFDSYKKTKWSKFNKVKAEINKIWTQASSYFLNKKYYLLRRTYFLTTSLRRLLRLIKSHWSPKVATWIDWSNHIPSGIFPREVAKLQSLRQSWFSTVLRAHFLFELRLMLHLVQLNSPVVLQISFHLGYQGYPTLSSLLRY